MEIRYFKNYSHCLGRDMEMKVYGHRGKPVLFIPCQAGRFMDFEAFHMIDHWSQWIEEGRCTVYAIDTIDNDSWAAKGGDCRQRIENHERWHHYVVDEMVPHIRSRSGGQNLMVFGCSMGAMHAANFFLRRPDLFNAVFAISGIYDSRMYFGDYMDDVLYQNTPIEYLRVLPDDHYYKRMYNDRRMLFAVGQGPWEDHSLNSVRFLEYIFREKCIPAKVEYWGTDVSHDWYWWFKMAEHYLPKFLH